MIEGRKQQQRQCDRSIDSVAETCEKSQTSWNRELHRNRRISAASGTMWKSFTGGERPVLLKKKHFSFVAIEGVSGKFLVLANRRWRKKREDKKVFPGFRRLAEGWKTAACCSKTVVGVLVACLAAAVILVVENLIEMQLFLFSFHWFDCLQTGRADDQVQAGG